ncbi:MAG: hypothetical protein RMY28_003060 [Nostoc sp. ChiSLP01]|nr:hypothetical protein [Nostoc sp. CmiSLP01]MDZ8289625.1 hypothetical protein [Nostoc sp. ChiSLP01]
MSRNSKKTLTFEDFWEKHQYTFPGFANGTQIAEICKDIARDAWEAARLSSPLDKAEFPLDKDVTRDSR